MNLLKKIFYLIFGTKQEKDYKRMKPTVDKINSFDEIVSALSNQGLSAKTDVFKDRLKNGESLEDLLPEAFAVVREASKRTLNMRHFDVQMMGGISLHNQHDF